MDRTFSLSPVVLRAKDHLRQATKQPLLLLLLAVDALLIALHVAIALWNWDERWPIMDWLRIDRDRAVSEWFEYGKLALAAALLIKPAVHGARLFRPIAACLILLLLDNALSGHEALGTLLAPDMSAAGQVFVFAGAGLLLLAWTAANFRHSPADHQSLALAFWAGVALLAVFGVAADFVHEVFTRPYDGWDGLLSLAEDGGELTTLSLLTTLAWQSSSNVGTADQGQPPRWH